MVTFAGKEKEMNEKEKDARENLVSGAEAGRRLGVGRAAVSNWGKRYGDFPKPVNRMYWWPDVEAYVVSHGLANKPKPKMRLYVWDDALAGYQSGMIFAIASSLEEARGAAREAYGNSKSSTLEQDLKAEPEVLDLDEMTTPTAWLVWGSD